MWRITAILWSLLSACGFAVEPVTEPPAKTYQRAVVIRFDQPIDDITQAFLVRKLDAAKDLGADLVIVEIHSPGGEINASFDLANRLRNLDWARTVAWIPEMAYSGAAVLSLGCDEILIHPQALLGDVGIIMTDEEQNLIGYAPEKILSVWIPKIRDLAAGKRRSPALAEAMMDKKIEVYEYRHKTSGETRYMTDADWRAAGQADWERGAFVPESRPDKFLTVTGTRALELKLAQATYASRAEVLARFGIRDNYSVLEWTAVDTTVMILTNGWVTALLLTIGLIALYVELSAPGLGIGGLVAALCFVIFFWAHFMGGTAEWLEVVLFLTGIACLGVELLLLPGMILPGLIGAGLIVVSLVLASQTFIVPHSASEVQQFTQSLAVVVGSLSTFLVAAVFITRRFGKLPIFNRLSLTPPPAAIPAANSPSLGLAPLDIGAQGVAQTGLRPAGKGRFGERIVDVVTVGEFVDRGNPIVVTAIAGVKTIVRAVDAS